MLLRDLPGRLAARGWITVTDRDSVVIHGRSDGSLNRHGVRIGTADIAKAIEHLPEVAESLVRGVDESADGYWVPLFAVLDAPAMLETFLALARERRHR